jgi:hypothetical protein
MAVANGMGALAGTSYAASDVMPLTAAVLPHTREAAFALLRAADPGGHGMAALCLAVLSATAIYLLTLITSGSPLAGVRAPTAPSLAAGHGIPRPPPDLRGLCISRT